MRQANIRIISDDKDIEAYLEVTLTLNGYAVNDPGRPVDLAIICHSVGYIAMHTMWEVRRELNPVIIMLDRDLAHGIQYLDEGADDYLAMPFDTDELAARVRSHLARRGGLRPPEPKEWDYFISHASPDKADFVQPLAEGLTAEGVRVWYDDFEINYGDSLREKIDEGLV